MAILSPTVLMPYAQLRSLLGENRHWLVDSVGKHPIKVTLFHRLHRIVAARHLARNGSAVFTILAKTA